MENMDRTPLYSTYWKSDYSRKLQNNKANLLGAGRMNCVYCNLKISKRRVDRVCMNSSTGDHKWRFSSCINAEGFQWNTSSLQFHFIDKSMRMFLLWSIRQNHNVPIWQCQKLYEVWLSMDRWRRSMNRFSTNTFQIGGSNIWKSYERSKNRHDSVSPVLVCHS